MALTVPCCLLRLPELTQKPRCLTVVARRPCLNQGRTDALGRAARAILKAQSPHDLLVVQTSSEEVLLEGGTVLDCWTDPRGWVDPSRKGCLEGDKVLARVRAALDERNGRDTRLVITSANALLEEAANCPTSAAKLVSALLAEPRLAQVVLLAWESTTNAFGILLAHLKAVSGGLLELAPSAEEEESGLVCWARFRPTKGKPVYKQEVVRIDKSGEATRVRALSVGAPAGEQPRGKEDEDEREAVNRLTTFNLGLKDEERTARDKVVLPFLKPEQKPEEEEEAVRINPRSAEGESKIYYEPDDADDWDEEDPDDDLDF